MEVLVERERCGAQAREQGADTGFDTRYLVSVKRKIRASFKVHNGSSITGSTPNGGESSA